MVSGLKHATFVFFDAIGCMVFGQNHGQSNMQNLLLSMVHSENRDKSETEILYSVWFFVKTIGNAISKM